MELLHITTGRAFLVNWDKRLLEAVAKKGQLEGTETAALGTDSYRMAVQAARSGVPVLASERCDRSSPQAGLSSVCIPLQSKDRVLGILQVSGGQNLFLENSPWLFYSLGLQIGKALENALLHKQVKENANIDGLTGALVRPRIETVLGDMVKMGERYGKSFAVLMIDIDRFKSFNDVHGHDIGDRVLKNVARIILDEVREADYVGRWGGSL